MKKINGRVRGKIFLIITMTLLFVACSKEEDKANEKVVDKSNHSLSLSYMSCTEEGLFYMKNDLLHYVSADTGEDMIYCFDPLCKHEPVSSYNLDSTCMASRYADKTRISYHNGFVYFFVSDYQTHKIYRMDISSGVRELVTELPFDCEINCIVFDKECVYYIAVIRDRDEEGITIKKTYDLVEVNLKDGKYRMITDIGEETGCNFFLFDVFEQTLFVKTAGNFEYHFYIIDLESLNVKYELDNEEYKQRTYFGIYDNESYYYAANEGKEIGIYNINTGEMKVLVEIDSENEFLTGYSGAQEKLHYSIRNTDTKTFKYFLCDVDEDETWDITEKCEGLGIVRYDVYRGMFLRYLYDETGELIGRSVVDEEKLIKY